MSRSRSARSAASFSRSTRCSSTSSARMRSRSVSPSATGSAMPMSARYSVSSSSGRGLPEQPFRLLEQAVGQIGAQLGDASAFRLIGGHAAGEHRNRQPHHREDVLRGRIGGAYPLQRSRAEGDANAVAGRLEEESVGRDLPVHDILRPRPLQDAMHLAQDRGDTGVRERIAAREEVGDARIVDVLADDGERVGTEPAPLDDRYEATMAKAAQQLRVRREMIQRVRLVAFRRMNDLDQHPVLVVTPLARRRLPRRDQVLRARPRTELPDDVEVGREVRQIGVRGARRVSHDWVQSRRKKCQTELPCANDAANPVPSAVSAVTWRATPPPASSATWRGTAGPSPARRIGSLPAP